MTSGEGFVLRDGAPRLTTWSCSGRERCLTPASFLVLRRFPRVEHVVDRLTLMSSQNCAVSRRARSSRPTFMII